MQVVRLTEDLYAPLWDDLLEGLNSEWAGKSWDDLDPEIREYWRTVWRSMGPLVLYKLGEVWRERALLKNQ